MTMYSERQGVRSQAGYRSAKRDEFGYASFSDVYRRQAVRPVVQVDVSLATVPKPKGLHARRLGVGSRIAGTNAMPTP